jgi:hypothetical protein
MALRNDRFPTDVETLDMLEIPLRANLRIGRIAWPLLEFDVLGLKKLTSSSSQVRHVTRLSGNFSIAKAQRAVQGVFEVKTYSIRCIRRYCPHQRIRKARKVEDAKTQHRMLTEITVATG